MQSRYHGANLGPFEAWLTLRGLRTLALRLREQCANALKIAEWLKDQQVDSARDLSRPADHPDHALAQQLFRANHFGGIVSFELRNAAEPEVFRFMERLKLIQAATSLGDVYSLLLYPAQSSHHALGAPSVCGKALATDWCACLWALKMPQISLRIWNRRSAEK